MKKIISIILIITMCFWGTLTVCAEMNMSYIVTASRLNIRENPNTNCKILATVSQGTILNGGASSGGWTPITWNNQRAYVFSDYIRPQQATNQNYSQADLDLLARVVNAEAGSDWMTDEHQRAVASVVLNRVADYRFPNTIYGVVYQRGQYACTWNGMINRAPTQRAIANAKYVLDNGVTTPTNVVFQAQFRQGKGVWKYIQGHYFCY